MYNSVTRIEAFRMVGAIDYAIEIIKIVLKDRLFIQISHLSQTPDSLVGESLKNETIQSIEKLVY